MNREQETLFALVKKSQFGSGLELNWDCIDIEALYNEASIQSVLGIVASEIPDDLINSKWQEVIYLRKADYIRYCHAEDELKIVLDNAAIPFVILKGNAAAISYDNPSLRTMGDIDFLVPQDLYDSARTYLIDNGYIINHESELYTRHIGLIKDGISFELHHHFSHDDNDIEGYLVDGFNSIEIVSVDGHEFPMLPKLANGLVLLDHLRNHLKSAVGLRQIIDWMMYVYRNLDDRFWNDEFKAVAEEKGMDTLAITVTRMCQLYLGLPESISWCQSADVETCKELMECVLSSGNFGRKNGKGYSVEKVSTSMKREGTFRWLQHAGEHNWKAYHKHHWLKPFCWLYQIFRYAKQGIKTGRNTKQLKSDFDRSKERYELLKKLNIS